MKNKIMSFICAGDEMVAQTAEMGNASQKLSIEEMQAIVNIYKIIEELSLNFDCDYRVINNLGENDKLYIEETFSGYVMNGTTEEGLIYGDWYNNGKCTDFIRFYDCEHFKNALTGGDFQ